MSPWSRFLCFSSSVCRRQPEHNRLSKMSEDGQPGDELRGLSVKFLSDGLLTDLSISDSDTVFDIEPKLREASKGKSCPRDYRPGCAYVDVADDPNAGVANYMLSYSWNSRVCDIVSALVGFCKRTNQRPETVRVWICCMCVNQHRVKEKQEKGEKVSFEEFSQTFRSKLHSIGKVLAMLSPWNDPLYIKRLWCIFEFATAMKASDIRLDIVLPARQEALFKESLNQDNGIGGLSNIFGILGKIKVELAEATYDDDKRNILAIVAPGVDINNTIEMSKACVEYNRNVVRELQSWFVDIIKRDLEPQLVPGKVTAKSLQVSSVFISLCKLLGGDKRSVGLKISERAICVFSESSLINTIEYCTLLRQTASIHRYGKSFVRAMELCKEVKEKLETLRKTETKEYCYLLHDMAICLAQMSKPEESIKMADLAAMAYRRACEVDTPDYANLLKSKGMTLASQGEIERAVESYQESIQLFEKLKSNSPWYYDALVQLGQVYTLKDHHDTTKAIELLEKAVTGLESLGLVDGIHFKTATEQLARLR